MSQARCVFSWVLEVPAGHRCPAHAHACAEIVVSFSGQGALYQDTQRHAYGPRTAFVYQPGGEHWIQQETAGRQLCLGVVGAGAELLPRGVREPDEQVLQLAAMAVEALRSDTPLRSARLDFLAGLIVLRLRELSPRDPQLLRSRAARARAIIESSLHAKMDLDELARRVYVSPRYLRELFQREFGASPLHYVIRRRIERAQQLLRETQDPVQKIAEECGFASLFYFSRMFKKMTGAAPTEYRARQASKR